MEERPRYGNFSTNQNCHTFRLANRVLQVTEDFVNRELILGAQQYFAVQFVRINIKFLFYSSFCLKSV